MFTSAEDYNQGTGRLSSQLAVLFTDFVGVENGDRVLDVGCGTGSPTFNIAENPQVLKVVGIDPSVDFVKYVRSQSIDARLDFEVADALNLPFAKASFDKTLALLVDWLFLRCDPSGTRNAASYQAGRSRRRVLVGHWP